VETLSSIKELFTGWPLILLERQGVLIILYQRYQREQLIVTRVEHQAKLIFLQKEMRDLLSNSTAGLTGVLPSQNFK
jgi:hypothetical protein